jgi:hypothetical protein
MIKAFLQDQRVKQRLREMSERSRANVFRRVLRKAAKPVVDELKAGWRGAKRRRGKVTRVVAVAQQATVRVWKKGDRKGTATLQIGTNYRRGGYAKVWHILENGFRHYGKNATYRPAPAEVREAKAFREAYFREAVGDIRELVKTKDGRAEITQRYRAIRQRYMSEHGDKEKLENAAWRDRNRRRESARAAGGRNVAGRRISRPIASRSAQLLATRARDMMVDHVLKGAR